jgi:sec-independent protein translocase protein TatC
MAIRRTDEDLFEESRMTFGEHLEELRKVFFKSLIGIAIGCVFGFLAANSVVQFLQRPLNKAIEEFRVSQAKKKLIEKTGFLPPEALPWLEEENLAPRTVLVDPGQFIRMLNLESTSDAKLSEQIKPYSFSADEIDKKQLLQFASELLEHDSEGLEGQRLDAIWQMLDQQQHQTIENVVDSGADDEGQLLEILNQIIDKQRLFESEAFSELTEPPTRGFWSFLYPQDPNPLAEMKKQLENEFENDLARRLNKVLIQLAFPDVLNDPRLRLQPIEIWETVEVSAQSLQPTEVFMIWVKAGVITGFFISSPWVFYQIWTFVASGLYRHERRYIYIYLPFSLILFLGGAGLAFFFVFEHVLRFLFQFNASMGIDLQPRIGYWLSFVMIMPLGFGLAFQLPLVMLFLNRAGILDVRLFIEKWRIAVFVIFLLSMILTPADPISMITLAIPLTFLYFGGILLCFWMPRTRNPFKESYEPA